MVISCGSPQEVEDTSLPQNESPVYPQTETSGTIETKFENESYGDVIQEPVNATDSSIWVPFRRSRNPAIQQLRHYFE